MLSGTFLLSFRESCLVERRSFRQKKKENFKEFVAGRNMYELRMLSRGSEGRELFTESM